MNIEKWINDRKFYFNQTTDALDIEDLLELLKTHAIVPREPSDEALIEWKKSSLGKSTRNVYSAMIKAAENE